MFNFLKWFKKKEPEIKEQTIKLEDFESLIQDLEQKEFADIYDKSNKIKSKISAYFKEISKIAHNLKESKITTDIDPRLKKRILIGRDNLADKCVFISKRFLDSNFEIKNWDNLVEFKEKNWKALKELTNLLSKHGEFVKLAFKKQMLELNNIFKNISLKLKELEGIVGEKQEKANAIISLKKDAKRLIHLKKQIEKSKKELEEQNKELESLHKNKEILTAKIKEIENSSQFKEKISTEHQISELKREQERLKLELRHKANALNKALRKYLHYYGELLDKEKIKIIEGYIHEPMEGMKLDKSKEIIEIIKDVKKLIEKNKLKFDEKTKQKIFEIIDKAPTLFEEYKSKIEKIEDEIKNLRLKLEKFQDNDYENAVETLKVSEKWDKEIEKEILNLKNKIKNLESEFKTLKMKVLEKLNKPFDIKVVIKNETFN